MTWPIVFYRRLTTALLAVALVALPGSQPTLAAPSGTVTLFSVPTPNAGPHGITSGPDGALWFTESSANKIGRITPDGAITEFPLPTDCGWQNGCGPEGITLGPDGALWFAEFGNVGRITTAGAITQFPLPDPSYEGSHITQGPDGAFWFTEERFAVAGSRQPKIGRITLQGAISEFAIPSGEDPFAIATGADGNLWFTEVTPAGLAWRLTPTGVFTQFYVGSEPFGVAPGPDGNIWVGAPTGYVSRITPAGTIARFPIRASDEAYAITTGPDGAIWFTDNSVVNRILSNGKSLMTFPLPPAPPNGAFATDLTGGPDGNIWVAEADGNNIARLPSIDALTTKIVAASGVGTITSSPAGISCPSDCNELYDHGTAVTLTANAAVGSTFMGWGGACKGATAPCSLMMSTNLLVSGRFYANADVAVTLADSPDPVAVGSTLTYTIDASNNGPNPSNATVEDWLPTGVLFQSVSTTAGTCTEATDTKGRQIVTCSLSAFAAGASATITIQATPTTAGTPTDVATIKGTGTYDANTANNTAKVTTTVIAASSAVAPTPKAPARTP